VSHRDDEGSALVEFTYLAVLLMVPLVYVLITVFQVQRAAFGTTEAARQGARAYEKAAATDLGEQRARDAIALALRDQGITDAPQVAFDCQGPCAGPQARVKVTVTYWVKLPVLGSVFGDARRGAIRVQASHVEFADRYAEFSGDPAPASLRHHYVAYRAFVRAKVTCIKAGQGSDSGKLAGAARRLADISLRHLRAGAVTLVLIGGLPGSGKSALARAAADRLGFAVLNSDRIRKELAGIEPTESAAAPYGAGIYTTEWTERCYAELLNRAETLLANGESVIADASWISAEHRAAAKATARRASAQLVQVRCAAPEDLMRRRMAARTADTSDANAEIARKMAAATVSWPGATTISTEAGGSGGDLKSAGFTGLVDEALTVIRPHGPDHVWRPTRPVMLPG